MSYNLPDGVTDAMIDDAFGGNGRCECGDGFDEHTEIDATDDPQVLLDALRKIDALTPLLDFTGKTRVILDKVLTACSAKNCTCRKFEPAGPREDDRY